MRKRTYFLKFWTFPVDLVASIGTLGAAVLANLDLLLWVSYQKEGEKQEPEEKGERRDDEDDDEALDQKGAGGACLGAGLGAKGPGLVALPAGSEPMLIGRGFFLGAAVVACVPGSSE